MAQIEPIYGQIGQRLRVLREREGLSQADMAAIIGVTQSAYSLLENGQRRMVVADLQKMSAHFRVPISWFFGEDASSEQLLGFRYRQLTEADRAAVNRIIEACSETTKAEQVA